MPFIYRAVVGAQERLSVTGPDHMGIAADLLRGINC